MPAAEAAALLGSTCGASRWVDAMVARRPFGSRDALLSAADDIWLSTKPGDWHEAFSHHPRIGEVKSASPQDVRGAMWSLGEQAGVHVASATVQDELAAVNRAYEARFGHIYIVYAAGRTAEEMLATARDRLDNDPEVELVNAAEELRKITRLRLLKLFGDNT